MTFVLVTDVTPIEIFQTTNNLTPFETQSSLHIRKLEGSLVEVSIVNPRTQGERSGGSYVCKGGDLHNERYLTICRKLGDCDVDHLWHLSWLFWEYFRKFLEDFPELKCNFMIYRW